MNTPHSEIKLTHKQIQLGILEELRKQTVLLEAIVGRERFRHPYTGAGGTSEGASGASGPE